MNISSSLGAKYLTVPADKLEKGIVSETSSEKNGKIETSFNLREKTETEKRLDALENGQEVQDGAISDLGVAVSGMAEKGGLT